MNAKDVLKPAAILFAICVLVSAALAGTNLLTKDKIAEAQAKKAEESRMVVLPEAEAFEERDGYYVGAAGGQAVGYVFETAAKGYGGDVKVMTGIGVDGNITGVIVLEHGETPGLGANAEKESFRDQYKQQPVGNLVGGIQVVKFQAPNEGEIQAMTGATITSTAVTNAVNQAIEQYQNVYQSEGDWKQVAMSFKPCPVITKEGDE